MNSVRLRLLILALAPLILLMPFLLLLGMTRWTADYDKVLIANVESDLRIAQQYLNRIMIGTGNDLQAVAKSVELAEALTLGPAMQTQFLQSKREALELDFLYYLPRSDALDAARDWPVIASSLEGIARTEIDIFNPITLATISDSLDQRARIDLIETKAAVPTERSVEDRGMVVHSASPVGQDGILVGGILLNRNLAFIDTINALVYLNAVTGGERQGTATLFLEDVRISTNVRLFEDVRALGTRVSAAVRSNVLDEGQTWLDRAFVVNDWYISGYLPLTDSFGNRVGMLYVGFLEAPFSAAKRNAFLWMMAAFAGVLLMSVPVFLKMAKGIFAPLEAMIQTMRNVTRGNLSDRIADLKRPDEIGQVAGHLNNLLDQVQDRDRKLRLWADELNQRVEERTAELHAANDKLEQTYKQLVMSEKLASIGEITAGVAHEINNPVAVIQGNMDVIRDVLGPKAKPILTEVNLIDSQVGRIQAIVGKLLKFAQPGELTNFEEAVDLEKVIEDCLVLVEHVLSKGSITVEKQISSCPPVRGIPGEIQQVVINLIVNAVQAMKHEGQIRLSLSAETRNGQNGVCLTVQDTGPGIPEDKIASVFDPFFTTKPGEGTGLGLSISQSLIQNAGGLIEAENAPEGGARFHAWLPTSR